MFIPPSCPPAGAAVNIPPGTRLAQVIEWLKGDDDLGNCMIVLDE